MNSNSVATTAKVNRHPGSLLCVDSSMPYPSFTRDCDRKRFRKLLRYGALAWRRPGEYSPPCAGRCCIVENWIVQDNLTMLRQLGIITDDELATVGTPTVATPAP